MRRLTTKEARERIACLEGIIRDTLWMARRYAHGRQSYAVGMYNDAARVALRLGVAGHPTDGSVFALDGTQDGEGSPEMSGLSLDEFTDAAASLNAARITEHPSRFSAVSLDRIRRRRIALGMSTAGRLALSPTQGTETETEPSRTGGERG